MVMSDVFISYSRTDKLFMARLYQELVDRQFDAWVDWEDIPKGARWLKEIYRGIEGADTFVCILSPDWLTSENCHLEMAHALKHNKRIVPVIYREVEIANIAGLWFEKDWEQTARANWNALKNINWLFFREGDDFKQSVQELLSTLRSDHEHVKKHTRYLVRAVEWDTENRRPEMLLRGAELLVAEQWLITAEGKRPLPTSLQKEYIEASRQEEEQRKKEERRTARRVQNFRRATVVLAIVGGLAIAAAWLAGLSANRALSEAENANQQVAYAQTQVADANHTLTPVGATLTSAAAAVAHAFTKVDEANQLAIGAQTQAAHAEETLTPVPLTITPLYVTLRAANENANQAQILAENAWHTLTPIPLTQTPIQQTMVANIEQLDNLQATGTVVAQEVQEQKDFAEALRLAALAERVLQEKINSTPNDPENVAALLAIRSLQIVYTPEADAALQQAIRTTVEEYVGYSFDTRENGVYGVAISPDNTRVLTVGPYIDMILWDLKTGRLLRRFPGENAWEASFSPDGKYIVTSYLSDNVKLWDAQNFQLLRVYPHYGTARFSPNGKYLLTLPGYESHDNLIKVWDVKTGTEVRAFEFQSAAMFSPDSRSIVIAGGSQGVRIWDIETGALVFSNAYELSDYNIGISPDSTMLLESHSGTARLLDLKTGEEIRVFHAFGSQSQAIFSPDGRFVIWGGVEGGNEPIRIWETSTGKLVRELHFPAPDSSTVPGPTDLSISTDSKYLLAGSYDGVARLWYIDYTDNLDLACSRIRADFSERERIQFGITDDRSTCPAASTYYEDTIRSLVSTGYLSEQTGALATYVDAIKVDLTGEDNMLRYNILNGVYTDFVMRATIYWGSESLEDECGFVFRQIDADNYYIIQINRNGILFFQKLSQGEWEDPRVSEDTNNAIQTSWNETNDLLLVANGETFTAFINGEMAGQFMDKSNPEGKNAVGAATYVNSNIAGCKFTDVWIWDLNKAQQ